MAGVEIDPQKIKPGFETPGSNQRAMRDRNERLVLSILRREGSMPKAEIARRTGLSAQTVSVIMRALEADGFLERGEKLRGNVGQPSIPMRLAPDGALFLGLKVGRRSAELILVNFAGREIAHLKRTYDYPTPKDTLTFVRSSVAKITERLSDREKSRIAGLGIAMPYFLWEWAAVIGVDESKMAAWKDCDLRAEIADLLDFPVYLGNDATCACGAELVFGETETPRDYLYIYIGYFIGGGVVLNGTLYTGSAGNAGAIGPFPVLDNGGRQRQLVDVASLAGLEARLKVEGCDVEKMWSNPDKWHFDQDLIDDWLAEAVPALVQLLLSAISIIDFSAVLIDGNLPQNIRSKVVASVSAGLQQQNLSGVTLPDIQAGSVGSRARAMGAASLPLSKRFMLEA